MGHLNILVVGDDFRDQLAKYQRADCADPESRHWVAINLLDGRDRPGKPASGSDNDAWRRWIAAASVPLLAPDQLPNLFGEHKWHWARVAANGKVLELVERTIPGGFIDWFEETLDHLILKPGTTGQSIDGGRSATEAARIAQERAGRARKRDIDFAAMLGPLRSEALAWWDRAHKGSGTTTWRTHAEIRAEYPQPHTKEIAAAAMARWCSQEPVGAIVAALRERTPSYMTLSHDSGTASQRIGGQAVQIQVDATRLDRQDYVARFDLRWAIGCSDVIANGALLDRRCTNELDAFLDAAPDDTWLTVTSVHA